MRLDLGRGDEEPLLEVLSQHLGHEQGGRVGLLHAVDRERLAGLIPLHVEHAVVIHRHQRHALGARHRGVARDLDQPLPVLVLCAPALGDGDAIVPARLEASHDAAHELGIGDAAAHAVVSAGLLRILEPLEAAEVRLDEDRRLLRADRDHRLAQAFAELPRRAALEHRHRRRVGGEPRAAARAQRSAVDRARRDHRGSGIPARRGLRHDVRRHRDLRAAHGRRSGRLRNVGRAAVLARSATPRARGGDGEEG